MWSRSTVCLVLAAAFFVGCVPAFAGTASSCITIDRSKGTRLINACNKAVMVCWKDSDLCKSECSEVVGANNDTLVTDWKGLTNYNSVFKQDYDEKNEKCTVGSPADVTYDSHHRAHPTARAVAQRRQEQKMAQRAARARMAAVRRAQAVRYVHATRFHAGGGSGPDLRGNCPEVGPMSPACLAYFHRHPNE